MTGKVNVACCILGLIYFLFGIVKLGPWPSHGIHDFMIEKFIGYATVFPTKPLGFIPNPDLYRNAIGIIELIAGLMLIFGSQNLRRLSCLVLMLIKVGAAQTLLCMGDYTEVPTPVLFSLALRWTFFKLKKSPQKETENMVKKKGFDINANEDDPGVHFHSDNKSKIN